MTVEALDRNMSDTPSEIAVLGDETKARLKGLGWTQDRFADWLGLHKTTLTKWWQVGVPVYALRLLDLLERYAVKPSWNASGKRSAPTPEDVKDALFSPVSGIIDTAISQGWNRGQIANALREIAGDLDGRGPSGTRE